MVPQSQVKKLPPEIRRQNCKRSVVETAMPPTGSCCSSTSPSRAISVNLESASDVSETVFVSVLSGGYEDYLTRTLHAFKRKFSVPPARPSNIMHQLHIDMADCSIKLHRQTSGLGPRLPFHFTLLYVMLRSL